ncbi:MAG: triphosphoribosyl-dephospho-CoA synthase [Bacteroidales bacterium]|nr:triphosphoribosyl-dephospho-CoA synthase [Bacteroidales bacterium]
MKPIEPLAVLLEAKEGRAQLRQQIAGMNRPSVSLNLNIPGFPKSNEITHKFFSICLDELKMFLKANLVTLADKDAHCRVDAAGDFFLVPVKAMPMSVREIKAVCETFEEKHACGRFIDVDVTDENGNMISSGKAKLCFYCRQKPADVCRHEGMHKTDELRSFVFSRMEDYCRSRFEIETASKLASLALRAVLTEISLTPKPGLVDAVSIGSHTDMNYRTFIRSTSAISAHFTDLVRAGFRFNGKQAGKALPVIRNIGLQMERDMFAATNQVNTQKGLIFLLGLSLFTCGMVYGRHGAFHPEVFRELIRDICRGITRRELGTCKDTPETHGEKVFREHGILGARGEAEAGFPLVFDCGLPVLKAHGEMTDEVLIQAFLSVAAQNNDTNIIHRGGMEVLNTFKRLSFNALNDFTPENYRKVIDYCLKENISPGGSADLLVVTIFIHSLLHS